MSELTSYIEQPLGLLQLERLGPRQYAGNCIDGAVGRVFGGHTLAQAVRAASLAIDDRRPIHSFHATFLRPGSSATPMIYSTEILKKGRSLDVVGFRAEQSSSLMLFGFASAQAPEPSVHSAISMPSVADPESLAASAFAPTGTSSSVRAPFDRRYLPSPPGFLGKQLWVKSHSEVASASAIDHTALLAYVVDFLVTRAAHVAMPTLPQVGASLDHAMWFHRPFRVDEWLFVSSEMTTFSDSRSLCTCHVFDRDGTLVATATQEALIRSS